MSLAAITTLLFSFSVQANDATTKTTPKGPTPTEAIATLGGVGIAVAGFEYFGSTVELPMLWRGTFHVSSLLYTAGRLMRDDSWKEKALEFPLAVMTLQVVGSDVVQSGNQYIPFFKDALLKMPKEALVGLETLILYMHGTQEAYKFYKKDIHKTMGWKINVQND